MHEGWITWLWSQSWKETRKGGRIEPRQSSSQACDLVASQLLTGNTCQQLFQCYFNHFKNKERGAIPFPPFPWNLAVNSSVCSSAPVLTPSSRGCQCTFLFPSFSVRKQKPWGGKELAKRLLTILNGLSETELSSFCSKVCIFPSAE